MVDRIFRAMHTIKGSSAMFGFDAIADFTHHLENAYDLVRTGEVFVTKELIDISLESRDYIRALLAAEQTGRFPKASEGEEILSALKKLLPRRGPREEGPDAAGPLIDASPNAVKGPGGMATYRIRFRPSTGLFATGANPMLLLNELKELGRCQVVAQTDRIPPLSEIDPESCYLYWDAVLTTDKGKDAIRDVFIFVEDESEILIEKIDEEALEEDTRYKKLGEILIERGDISPADLRDVLEQQKRLGEMLVNADIVDGGKVEAALAEQVFVRDMKEHRHREERASSVRVRSEKLDTLVDLVGELVTVQARLTQKSTVMNDAELVTVAEEVERLTSELRDNTMSIRMLPIGSIFSKFKRLVRDLSNELGKDVELTTGGADTELDKTVIEKLNDPLVHLIRNCLDHGIEPPDERKKKGKPSKGTIQISAAHSGADVLISVKDDGRGLDHGLIRTKALSLGLVPDGAELRDHEINSLIFSPGFSTATNVTGVSGRGVGMDVVRKNIESLRGSIEVKSIHDVGTSIVLKLPLTLAIIEGLLVRIDDDKFVIPLSSVEECVELTRNDVKRSHGRHVAHVRGEIVPYIRLREQFRINGGAPEIEQIVIITTENRRVGFVVDNVIGEHQTVIKTLGRVYKDIEGLSGATILGDGSVALILDIHKLSQLAESEEERHIRELQKKNH